MLKDGFAFLIEMPHSVWSWLGSGTALAVSLFASGHAMIHKREARSALWWVSVNLFLPGIGPVLYYLFGINRIKRKAHRMRRRASARWERSVPTDFMSEGNRVTVLENGENAYPAMLGQIARAKTSIGMTAYIFDRDEIGLKFAQALGEAVKRGVQVRVLVDDVGDGFFWNSIQIDLNRHRVPNASFLPTLWPSKLAHLNLRNHRKILTIDGHTAFTGGMNISVAHHFSGGSRRRCQDIHFQIEGPVASQIQDVFRSDWQFTTEEILSGPAWFPVLVPKGNVHARAIPDGPDQITGQTRSTIISALAHARKSVRIMTPYFLPDTGLITALQMAVINGVRVEILVPKAIDWVFVQWASKAMMWQSFEVGCRIWESPPPFHHGKLMIVDEEWVLLGSSNWDARSLRLNFEFNMECRNNDFALAMANYFEGHKTKSNEVTLNQVDSRPLPTKLRDGFARLFTPVL